MNYVKSSLLIYAMLYLYVFQVWKEKQEEEMKAKLADNSRYKMYRRYMKKGGPGQMTFGPEQLPLEIRKIAFIVFPLNSS